MPKIALVSGISGQTASYLAEILLEKDYIVHGILRRSSTSNTSRIDHLLDQEALMNRRLFIHYGDLQDGNSIQKIVEEVNPDEVYNLAAMSQVRISYDIPAFTGEVTGVGFARVLEAVKNFNKDIKIYQASSSEMFGKVQTIPQNETTPFYPRSPYGCAKAYAFYLGRAYREGYGMKVYNGILFNHESPRRGEQFLSKKVAKAAVAIKQGRQDKLYLGNLDAKRDMGSAKEYAYWIWRIVQHDTPDDFVIANGETHSMQEFVEKAFTYLDLDWKQYVEIDKGLFRPAEVDLLIGDYSKAKEVLGYEPEVKFDQLVRWMVDAELTNAK
ncbi:GDP-mannose 4,6-dehydratase [Candidatus Roizmanbacteria bacterium]|nr:GDP-mannose 4,6-dehydratase [Candidatus Roizmanbacteria bacterium]